MCGMARHWEPRGKRPKMMSKSLIIVPMSALATPFRVVVLPTQSSSSSSNRIDPLLAVHTVSGALVLDLLTWDLIVCEHTRWRLGCEVKGLEGYGAGDQTRFAATSSVYLLPSSPFSAVPDDPCTYWKCQEAAARVGQPSGMDGGRDEERIRFGTGSVRPDVAFELTGRTARLAENTKEKAQRSVGRSVGWVLTLRQRRAG